MIRSPILHPCTPVGEQLPAVARALPATVIAALGGEGDDIHHRVVLPSGEVRVVRELATVDFTVVRRTEPKS